MGVFRKRSGSALCYACGKLNRVDAAVCFYCGRRQPGLWGFAPALGRLIGRVSVAKAITLVCGVAYLLALALDPGAAHAPARPLQSPVAELRRAGRARDDGQLCPGPGAMVDAPDRHLPARRPAPHRVQHALGLPARARRRGGLRAGAPHRHLHRGGRAGLRAVGPRRAAVHRRGFRRGVRLARRHGGLCAAPRRHLRHGRAAPVRAVGRRALRPRLPDARASTTWPMPGASREATWPRSCSGPRTRDPSAAPIASPPSPPSRSRRSPSGSPSGPRSGAAHEALPPRAGPVSRCAGRARRAGGRPPG